MVEWIAAILVVSGAAFALIASIGILRMPDVYIRMHASTKAGTVGVGLICAAVMVIADGWVQRVEAGFVVVFILVTAPIAAHLIARAAFLDGVPFTSKTRFEDGCENFGTPRLKLDQKVADDAP